MKILEQLKDILLLREGSDIDNIIVPPTNTTGSILWGILLRSAIIVILSLTIIFITKSNYIAIVSMFALWYWVALPAYQQYNKYNQRVEILKTDTLCGKCKHFIEASQLCAILDEHIGIDTIPCNGEEWEPSENIFK